MQIGILIFIAVVVVSVVIAHTVCSKDFQYGIGLTMGRKDCKKGCRTKYQTLYLERKEKGILSERKMGYIDGYNCQMNQK